MNNYSAKHRQGIGLESIPEDLDLDELLNGQDQVQLDDFHSYAPDNKCIYRPDGALWPNSAVDARLPKIGTGTFSEDGKEIMLKASLWLAQNRSVEQMTWIPGEAQLIKNKLVLNGAVAEYKGNTIFNLYRPPTIGYGDPAQARPWIDHVRNVYPENWAHLLDWFAHRVQRPGEKINHALIMGGSQGIGKDTILEPLSRAVGVWNFNDVTPAQLMGRFNGFLKSVVLRVSEARDMGNLDRYGFYEHLKIYTASPPEVLAVDEKHRREYGIMNVCGVVITTNHKTGGVYLPADDRRHFVAWSEKCKNDFSEHYWQELWAWYEQGGFEHVAAFLKSRDLSAFDPKAPPEKTPAFWEIVDASRAPEDTELADALYKLSEPAAVTAEMIKSVADYDFVQYLSDRRNNRKIPHRFEEAGYVAVRNPGAKDGRWVMDGSKITIYALKQYAERERIDAATKLVSGDLL